MAPVLSHLKKKDMNRQLKFREWLGKEFHYWGFMEDGSFILPTNIKGPQQRMTGLLAKSGKEIYEGDILNWDYCGTVEWNEWMKDPIYQVVYRDGYFVCGIGLKKDLFLHAFRFKHTEVVGNIYENPDLLK